MSAPSNVATASPEAPARTSSPIGKRARVSSVVAKALMLPSSSRSKDKGKEKDKETKRSVPGASSAQDASVGAPAHADRKGAPAGNLPMDGGSNATTDAVADGAPEPSSNSNTDPTTHGAVFVKEETSPADESPSGVPDGTAPSQAVVDSVDESTLTRKAGKGPYKKEDAKEKKKEVREKRKKAESWTKVELDSNSGQSMSKAEKQLKKQIKVQAAARRNALVLRAIMDPGADVDGTGNADKTQTAMKDLSPPVHKSKNESKAKDRIKVKAKSSASQPSPPRPRPVPVVSQRQLKGLKTALIDPDQARAIIAELRTMRPPGMEKEKLRVVVGGGEEVVVEEQTGRKNGAGSNNPASAAEAVEGGSEHSQEGTSLLTTLGLMPRPLKAACLDCGDEEAMRRREQHERHEQDRRKRERNEEQQQEVKNAEGGGASASLDEQVEGGNGGSDPSKTKGGTESGGGWSWGWFGMSKSSSTTTASNTENEAGAASSPSEPISATSPTSLLPNLVTFASSPTTALLTSGVSYAGNATGAFDILATVSGTLIKSSGADENVTAPLDRMAIWIHWFGFEITMPPPSLAHLGTAKSISGAFLGFLQTICVAQGVPEMLPFIRYISMYVDLEFQAIQGQDHGNGVILAASWFMPLALVPRPWDLPLTSTTTNGTAPGRQAPVPPPSASSSQSAANTPTALPLLSGMIPVPVA